MHLSLLPAAFWASGPQQHGMVHLGAQYDLSRRFRLLGAFSGALWMDIGHDAKEQLPFQFGEVIGALVFSKKARMALKYTVGSSTTMRRTRRGGVLTTERQYFEKAGTVRKYRELRLGGGWHQGPVEFTYRDALRTKQRIVLNTSRPFLLLGLGGGAGINSGYRVRGRGLIKAKGRYRAFADVLYAPSSSVAGAMPNGAQAEEWPDRGFGARAGFEGAAGSPFGLGYRLEVGYLPALGGAYLMMAVGIEIDLAL